MADDFQKDLVKEYKFWSVYVHRNQDYLGRCVVWCKRDNALDLADSNLDEQKELFLILKELREAAKRVFNPDWFNYSFLGNEVRHLHGHFVPRYAKSKTFMGTVFKDKLYGHNWKTNHAFVTPEVILKSVKNKLFKALG